MKNFLGLMILTSMSCGIAGSLVAEATPVYNARLMQIQHMPEEPMVKVLLTKDQQSIQVDVKGGHNIYDPYTGKTLETTFMGSSYTMTPTTDGIKWGQTFPGIFQLMIVPDNQAAPVMVNGISYGGVVSFYQVDNRLFAVNWVSLEEFTSSLLSTNFLPKESDQKEALAAYAIAVRSKAAGQMKSSNRVFWDISAESCGYRGLTVIRTDRPFVDAMKSTKKIIMTSSSETGTSSPFDVSTIDSIRKQMPPNEINEMALKGKDARQILHRFYPAGTIGVADKTAPKK